MTDQFEYPKHLPGAPAEGAEPDWDSGAGGGRVYEDDIRKNFGYGLDEGGKHFDKKSRVYQAMRKLAIRLDTLEIPYVVVGGLALLEHGFPRFTEDVDLLVTKDALARIHEELAGRGYRPVFAGSKNLRDTELGVKIEFLITGDFPGDGKAKPVSFPDPNDVTERKDGIRVVELPVLINLKLASGMTNPDRLKDLSDVQELAKLLGLSREFAEYLSPYVRDKYLELLPRQTRYIRLWRNELMNVAAEDLGDTSLEAMYADGVKLDPDGGTSADAMLYTFDSDIAHKYDMHPEDEFWDSNPTKE